MRNPIMSTQNSQIFTKPYTALEAELYDLLRGPAPDSEISFYHSLIKKKGGISLELGSGTGRLMIPLLEKGIIVDGLELSNDMIKICQNSLSQKKLKANLYEDDMTNFSLREKYNSIFIEGGTFMLLKSEESALNCLRAIYNHLNSSGQVIIELFYPLDDLELASDSSWRLHKKAINKKDNAYVTCSYSIECDVLEQIISKWTKYDIFNALGLIGSQIVLSELKWYSKREFYFLLEKVGFSHIDCVHPAIRDESDTKTVMAFIAIK